MTAAATTGPANGPRPASSMPQTRPLHDISSAKSGIAEEDTITPESGKGLRRRAPDALWVAGARGAVAADIPAARARVGGDVARPRSRGAGRAGVSHHRHRHTPAAAIPRALRLPRLRLGTGGELGADATSAGWLAAAAAAARPAGGRADQPDRRQPRRSACPRRGL